MSIVYSAPNPMCNATVSEGNQLVAYLAANGFPGATLLVNPIGSASEPAGTLIPLASFSGVPSNIPISANTPIYLQVQVPGKPDVYDVGLVNLFLFTYGMTIAQTLV